MRPCTLTGLDVQCYSLSYLQQRRKFQCRSPKIRVTHSGNDDMDLKIYPHFTTLKPKAMGKHLVGLVQPSCEFLVLTSYTLNNVENLRAGALK